MIHTIIIYWNFMFLGLFMVCVPVKFKTFSLSIPRMISVLLFVGLAFSVLYIFCLVFLILISIQHLRLKACSVLFISGKVLLNSNFRNSKNKTIESTLVVVIESQGCDPDHHFGLLSFLSGANSLHQWHCTLNSTGSPSYTIGWNTFWKKK